VTPLNRGDQSRRITTVECLDFGAQTRAGSSDVAGPHDDRVALTLQGWDQGTADKYKFVSLETNANGESVLTLIQVVEASQHLKCGHSNGYFDCLGRQEWALRKPGT